MEYGIALAMSSILGVIFNYTTFGRIVFRDRLGKRPIVFALTYAGLYALNLLLLQFLIGQGLDKYSSQAILMLPMAFLSFVLINKFVFR
jgi:putative flippase GtrA